MSLVTQSTENFVIQFLDRYCSTIISDLNDPKSSMNKKLIKRKNSKKNYYSVEMPEFYTSFTLDDRNYVIRRLTPDLRDLGYRCVFHKRVIGYALRIYWL